MRMEKQRSSCVVKGNLGKNNNVPTETRNNSELALRVLHVKRLQKMTDLGVHDMVKEESFHI